MAKQILPGLLQKKKLHDIQVKGGIILPSLRYGHALCPTVEAKTANDRNAQLAYRRLAAGGFRLVFFRMGLFWMLIKQLREEHRSAPILNSMN